MCIGLSPSVCGDLLQQLLIQEQSCGLEMMREGESQEERELERQMTRREADGEKGAKGK